MVIRVELWLGFRPGDGARGCANLVARAYPVMRVGERVVGAGVMVKGYRSDGGSKGV